MNVGYQTVLGAVDFHLIFVQAGQFGYQQSLKYLLLSSRQELEEYRNGIMVSK